MRVKEYKANTKGQDYVVGDIHGMFSLLHDNLKSIGFDASVDRLFSVGDLADRGAESAQVLDLLAHSWFHPVMGNHEEIVIMYERGHYYREDLINVGAGWWLDISQSQRDQIVKAYERLPLGIEVETALGPVGIMHAQCPFKSWKGFKSATFLTPKLAETCLWGMGSSEQREPIEDVRAVVVGHHTQKYPIVAANVHLIDTGAVYPGGYFTILNLADLKAV